MITIIIQPHVHYIHAHIPYIIAICHIPYCVLYILYIHTIYIQELSRGLGLPTTTTTYTKLNATNCYKFYVTTTTKQTNKKQNKKTK